MPTPPQELAALVLDKIGTMPDAEAATYFGVSLGTIAGWKKGKNAPSLAAAQKVWDETLLCQTPELWGKTNEGIALLLPIYEDPEPMFLITLIRSMRLYGIEKIAIIPKLRTLIEEARNDLAERALLSTAEWFIFADCDMILPCGNGAMLRHAGVPLAEPRASFNAFDRIMSHPKEARIVGGLYRDRRGTGKVQCESAFRAATENERLNGCFTGKTSESRLEEVGWTAFGFVRVHRSVFEEMKAAATPGGILADIAPPPPPRDKEPPGYFGRSNVWRGEDVAFCRRAGKLGIKTYVDTGLVLGHVGKRVY